MQKRWMLPALVAALATVLGSSAMAANPGSGTVSPSSPTISYTGGPYTGSNPSGVIGDPDCDLFPGTCDDYLLTVDIDAAYITAHPNTAVEIKTAWPGPSDFDLLMQTAGGLTVNSSGNAAGQPEVITFYPNPGTTQYRLRTVVYSAVNETFTCTIRIIDITDPSLAAVNYQPSTDVFTCNKHLTGETALFDHGGDGEPAVGIDGLGNTWITGIIGVGGGIGLWKIAASDICAQSPVFQNQPDAGQGGGDTDMAIATQLNALGNYNIYTSSLSLANVTSSTSVDGGQTFVLTPVSNEQAVEDRQWNAAYGVNTIYLSFNVGATQPGQQLEFYRSSAAGAGGTFAGPFFPRANQSPTATYGLGNMAVDRRDGGNEATLMAGPDGQGNVYQGFHENDGAEVWIAVSRDFGTTWSTSKVFTAPASSTVDHKFTWVCVDGGGTVYTCWSNDRSVFYSYSTDIKTTNNAHWSLPRRVNNGVGTKTCVLPMIEAGSAGRIVLGWYGTSAPNNITPGASWNYFTARCNNATDLLPVIEQEQVSDHVVHTGPVCENGLSCACCRDLLECQELGINPVDGSSLLTYAGAGGIYVTHEVKGASGISGKTVADNSGACPIPPTCITVPPPGASACILPGVKVLNDGVGTGDIPPVSNAQQDIQSVSVAEPDGIGDAFVFTMKVTNLNPASLPPNAFWRMIWEGPGTGVANRHYVSMVHCATGEVFYEYGHFTTGSVSDGVPDAGELSADGTIRITIAKDKVGTTLGAPGPGTLLSGFQADTRHILGNCPTTVGAFAPVDTAGTQIASYVVRGNDYCTPQTVTCPNSFVGPQGDYPVSFFINNPSTANRIYKATLNDPQGWVVGGAPQDVNVGPVTPGSSLAVPVTLRLAGNCDPQVDDLLTWTVTATDLPASGNPASCQTTASCYRPSTGVSSDGANRLSFAMLGSNPFRGSTAFSYSLPKRSPVRLEIFSVTGQRVASLVNQVEEAGSYAVPFSMARSARRRLGPGVYLVRLTAGDQSRRIRVIALD